MSRTPKQPPSTASVSADADGLAVTRERFLSAEKIEPAQVRDTILASWWRSRHWNVAADRIELTYLRDPDLDTPLTHSALPVLRHLRENLDGQPISIILTDPAGVVLSRMTADRDLTAHLDRVNLAPGFSYAEQFVGTNGIGTALEGGRPMHVFGHEHYAEHLEDLACAAVPIHHPISGKTVGAIDLTCWRRDAGPLLLALAKNAAGQIQQALLADSGVRELELLQEYLRTCRRTAGIVFALNNDVVMMNDQARQVLDPAEQAVLLGQASQTLAGPRPSSAVDVQLPSGLTARLHCRPVPADGRRNGGVVHVKLSPNARPALESAPTHGRVSGLAGTGLVGSGVLWLRGVRRVEEAFAAGEWVVVEGEPGVGKLAVIRAVHDRHDPGGHFKVLDAAGTGDPAWAAAARREIVTGSGTVVVRHLDRLGPGRVQALAAALLALRSSERRDRCRVAATMSTGAGPADLLRFFPTTVEIPPLRHHSEDVQELVPQFLGRLVPDGRLVCSPEAVQVLVRASWPGNVEQLWQALRRTVQRRRTGSIQPQDLPPEARTVSRRLLSTLESIERDAIVQSLIDNDGNKVKAADSLGMSRATIYRKIHEYGIVTA
ncbi:GAF domain-containing protein [Dactylosporangium sp. NPDC049140]|uniref:sigma-54-dependent Fis family transcriptional regulator n=1 Tax=Dactylosporangium sp. NPDC049140 TaxID=3155647 RepID=UPI0033CAC1CB